MKQSLGAKTRKCELCPNIFPMVRYDQKFCSLGCRNEAKKFYKREAWIDRVDREKQNIRRSELYYRNRSETLEKQRQWRLQNPTLAKAKSKQTYERNKEKHAQRTRAYRAAHPEIRRKEYRNVRQKRPWAHCLSNAKNRSDKKSLAFDLTRDWCEKIWTNRCAVTNLPFSFGTQSHYPFAPSVDRIDSNKGYTQDNCRFVLFAVNSLKGIGTDEQMLEIAKAIVTRLILVPQKVVCVET